MNEKSEICLWLLHSPHFTAPLLSPVTAFWGAAGGAGGGVREVYPVFFLIVSAENHFNEITLPGHRLLPVPQSRRHREPAAGP